jgi:CheY-like chemotaxis protein
VPSPRERPERDRVDEGCLETRFVLRSRLEPCGRAAAPREEPRSSGRDQAGRHVAARPDRILVVDDDEMLRDLVSAMLEMEGRVVEVVSDGPAGLAAIAASRPALVLLDLNMPGMTGFEVIERLKDHPSAPPVIAMSGMDVEPPGSLAVRPYVYGYLAKPFTHEQLVKTCARALAASEATAEVSQEFKEKRAQHRRNLLVPAALLSPDGMPAALGQILNLSPDGAQLDLGASLKPGMEVAIAFDIPGGHGPFRVTARVQWKREGKLGLSFLDMRAADRERLVALLATP